MVQKKAILTFQTKILKWYYNNKRSLPWRNTKNPYHILVSEIMLQQTQVDRVIPKYLRFLRKYPTLAKLSKASKRSLLASWQGLGYNHRVLRLRELAEQVGKHLPKTYDELVALSGIGPYTANAVLAFAHNRAVPVIDTNIRRVLMHSFKLNGDKQLAAIAIACVPKGKSRIWHNALMDYGAMVLTAKKTGIESKTKQSRFTGSNRWVRGEIIRRLLKRKILISAIKKELNHANFDSIIQKMQKEHIITVVGNTITLAK